MGRTEFLTETDCERALVGRAKAKASTRAKWRSSPSACRRVLEKCLTPPTLLEMGMFRQQSGARQHQFKILPARSECPSRSVMREVALIAVRLEWSAVCLTGVSCSLGPYFLC